MRRILLPMIWLARLCVLLACLGLVGCTSDRDRVWAQLQPAQQRWYRSMWGSSLSDDQMADQRTEFECVWEGIEDAGGDPAEDFECQIRRMDRFTACLERDPSGPCVDEADAVCPLSAAAVAAQGQCRIER